MNQHKELLLRCLPFIEQEVQLMADLTRHAPLDEESQKEHDNFEYESEKLLKELRIALDIIP